jgi:hypothetical protein
LNLPSAEITKESLNFVSVGNDVFALHKHFLKPFPARNLTAGERVFNYYLGRARRTAENAFGVTAN